MYSRNRLSGMPLRAMGALLLLLTTPASAQTWEQANGPYGGTVYSIVTSPDQHVWIGSGGGGVFLSSDLGENWGYKGLWVNDLVVVPDTYVFAGTRTGIYRSADYGDSWELCIGIHVTALTLDDSGILYAGTWRDGIYISVDMGATWGQASDDLNGIYIEALESSECGGILAGTHQGLYISEDGGNSWRAVSSGIGDELVRCIARGPNGAIYAGTANGGVVRSDDCGDNWVPTNLSIRVWSLAVDSTGTIYAGSDSQISRSFDGGDYWESFVIGYAQLVWAIGTSTAGYVFAGMSSGAYRSADQGSTWSMVVNGLSCTIVYDCEISPEGLLFAATHGSGFFRSDDGGDKWTAINTGLTLLEAQHVALGENGLVFGGVNSSGLFRSRDNGDAWEMVTGDIQSFGGLLVASSGDVIAASSGSGGTILRSSDDGDSWEIPKFLGSAVRSLAEGPEGCLLAGTNGGVFTSVDGGYTWVDITGDLPSVARGLSWLIDHSGDVLMGTTAGLFRWDGSSHWSSVGQAHVYYALRYGADGDILAGTRNHGVVCSPDNTVSWMYIGDEVANPWIWSLSYDDGGNIFAATSGNGIWRTVECEDSDLDYICDQDDNCIAVRNTNQLDFDDDTIGNDCDNCQDDYNPNQADTDGDGIGDLCDNCPSVTNADQTDTDDDGSGDLCDVCPGHDDNVDLDSDGVPDGCDVCPGFDDSEDADSDGVPDGCDNCPSVTNADQTDTDDDGSGDLCDACTDTDGDTFGNSGFTANTCGDDNCPESYNADQADADGDGVGDICDPCTDTDSDGFGDPGFSTNSCPVDNCADIYNVDQLDADGDGIGDACDNLTVNYNASPRCGSAPLTVSFIDLSASFNPVTSWQWDFGDGGTSTDQNPVHEYQTVGGFDVTLIISDGSNSDTLIQEGYVTTQEALSADFVGVPVRGEPPLTVVFEPVLGGVANDYFWEFGDGETSILPNPIHIYNTAGIYNVTLTAQMNLGECDQQGIKTRQDYIVVSDLVAEFSASPIAGIVPLTVQFVDESGGTPTSWLWDFGDGNTSTLQHPSHQFVDAGQYDIKWRH